MSISYVWNVREVENIVGDGRNGPDDTVVTKARLDHNLSEEQDEADAAFDHEASWPGTRSLVRIFYETRSPLVRHLNFELDPGV
ncbi:hypothetical protein RQ479_13510 [Mesorhizobium sp. ISC25]|uniref:hypothetical protein n=1 Tax=Mesorhizobium sp. ISC25 TaxID=3077335 RepID=UPI0035D6C8DA